MKVRELIELLMSQDPEARVSLMTQRAEPAVKATWVVESELHSVCAREDCMPVQECEPGAPRAPAHAFEPGTRGNDVFLVEGEPLRYGPRAAWKPTP